MLETNEYIRLANMLREVAKSIDDMGDSYVSGILFASRVIGKLGGETDEVEG